MFQRILLIIIIIFEQVGVKAPFSVDKNFTNNPFLARDFARDQIPGSQESFLKEIGPLPSKISDSAIDLKARSFIAIDKKTGRILASKEPTIRIPMASLTKIMTAVLVLENTKPDDYVTISKNAVLAYGEEAHLRPGENITVENLLYALLLSSSNDSAVAFAEHVSGSESEFARLMNEKASKLHLTNTKFVTASGLDDPNHYSSALDLAMLTRYALRNKKFREIVSTKIKTITSKEGITHNLKNTDILLKDGDIDVLGGKTGYTEEAGECLIIDAEKGGNEIITVVLGSQDRFGETKKLLKWSFEAYKW